MKISGFTFCRNATRLFYPVKESILSILPLVDEFIVALGDGAAEDKTEEEIRSIHSEKIRIIYTQWDLGTFTNGTEYAKQTDIAKSACTGDWLFYLQSDEVVHEKYLSLIRESCKKYIDDKSVEGFLFRYRHFWGDFEHYVVSHAWYGKEIRIIRNDPEIHSWRDAQSFRRIPDFDGRNYNQKKNTQKLNVVELNAFVYHYGFVRPPVVMQKKRINHNTNYRGLSSTQQIFKGEPDYFDYGDLNKISLFRDTHPEVMKDFISKFNWRDLLHFGSVPEGYTLQKHEKWKYRFLSRLEQTFFQGNQILNFKNYKKIK